MEQHKVSTGLYKFITIIYISTHPVPAWQHRV
jgi:hypothetical protein